MPSIISITDNPPRKRSRNPGFLDLLGIYTGLFVLFSYGCTEIYKPETDPSDNILVVEGLLTDTSGPHLVRLSLTGAFADDGRQVPLRNAIVQVEDQTGSIERFRESQAGHYFSSQGFAGVPGYDYVLRITTGEGEIYESTPQRLIPVSHSIDTIFGEYREARMVRTPQNDGRVLFEEIAAIEVFGQIINQPGIFPKMRFEADILLQYWMMEEQRNPNRPGFDPPVFYCRIRNRAGEYPNITRARELAGTRDIVNHNFGYIPKEKRFYTGVRTYGNIVRRLFIIDQFSLNEDSYTFYQNLGKLITAEGRMFDPVAAQLNGNIRCVTNEELLALGLFEVSGKASSTFAMNPEPFREENIFFIKTHDLDHLPQHECFLETIPPLWVY